jgi:hypothetical protein
MGLKYREEISSSTNLSKELTEETISEVEITTAEAAAAAAQEETTDRTIQYLRL